MQCQFCQQEIKAEAQICDWCGRRQEPKEPKESEELKPLPRQFGRIAGTKPAPAPQVPATRWEEIRGFLKGDPLLLAVFILLGLNALRGIADFVGITGAFGGGVLSDVFAVAAFLGMISWRFWAWVLVVFSQALTALGSLFLLSLSMGHPAAVILALLSLAVSVFVLAVLIPRRDYFE